MDIQELKKILATLSIAGLLTAGIPFTASCASNDEGTGPNSKKGTQTEEAVGEEKPADETPAPSSVSGDESSAGSTEPDEVPAPSS